MFERNLTQGGHRLRYVITSSEAGWEVRKEADGEGVRTRVYDDWHRVERARTEFQVEIHTLEREGWQTEPA
jgi:hypothetical protein